MIKKRILFYTITCVTILFNNVKAQDSLSFKDLNRSKLSFFLDDTYFFFGASHANVYYSNHFRAMSAYSGFCFGIEQDYSLSGKAFLISGVNFTQRNFAHKTENNQVVFINNYIDVPLVFSFDLPGPTVAEFRLLLGANTAFRIGSGNIGNYSEAYLSNPSNFIYSPKQFHSVDFGWLFGLSAEYKNFIIRLKSYSGLTKITKNDRGMSSSFNLELGYFLFRSIKKH